MEPRESRRRRRAIERQDRGYRFALGRSVPTVANEDWMSQFEVAERLGVSMARVAFLIQGEQIEPVHDSRGRAGVRRETVDREAARRSDAGVLKRFRIFLTDLGRSLLRGI